MNKLVKYEEFINELNDYTLDKAASKANDHGQTKLAQRFLDHKDYMNKKRNNSIFGLFNDYTFGFHLYEYVEGNGSDDIYPEKGSELVEIKFNHEYIEDEEARISITYDVVPKYKDQIELEDDNHLLAKIDMDYIRENDQLIIEDGTHHKNKFKSKKDAIKFVDFLHNLYMLEDKNTFVNLASKLNKTKLTRIVNTGGLAGFIDRNFGDWKTFKSKINLRKLYDVH